MKEKPAELPEELFDPLRRESIEYFFINLNGEKESYPLEKGDYLLQKKCYLDGTNLIVLNNRTSIHALYCPCCESSPMDSPYKHSEKTIEEYIQNKKTKNLQRQIQEKQEELSKLEQLLNIVKNRDSIILKKNRENSCYNKVNQSEQKNRALPDQLEYGE